LINHRSVKLNSSKIKTKVSRGPKPKLWKSDGQLTKESDFDEEETEEFKAKVIKSKIHDFTGFCPLLEGKIRDVQNSKGLSKKGRGFKNKTLTVVKRSNDNESNLPSRKMVLRRLLKIILKRKNPKYHKYWISLQTKIDSSLYRK
jgi:hypothetical protein